MKFLTLKAKICLLLVINFHALSHAETLTFHIVDQGGVPLEGAVVYVTGGEEQTAESNTHTIDQIGEKFAPYVLAISKGDKILFRNSDLIGHHVYSFSDTLKLNAVLSGNSDSELFEARESGIIAIGCNIHDNMAAFIHVAPTNITAITDEKGVVTMDVPSDATTVRAWHYRMPRREAVSTALTNAELSIALRVRPSRGDPQERRRDRRSY